MGENQESAISTQSESPATFTLEHFLISMEKKKKRQRERQVEREREIEIWRR